MTLGPYANRRRDVWWWIFVEYGLPLLVGGTAFGVFLYMLVA